VTHVTALVLLFLSWGLACGASGSSEEERWVSYEPTVIELSGMLMVSMKFGPPNYGEDPETDERLKVPVLVLSEPLNVRGDPDAQVNIESVRGVKEIQLIFLRQRNYDGLVNSRVVARGTLSHAVSGHHFTEVVMTVEDLKAAP
jgi:hypothetical protein